MIRPAKSALIFLLALLSLTACADSKWPTWLTGEPDESVLSAPRVVKRPASKGGDVWPSLGAVPDKAYGVMTPDERRAAIDQLNAAQLDAAAVRERIEATTSMTTSVPPLTPVAP